MRNVVIFLVALGLGSLTVIGQEDRNAELKRKIAELEALLKNEVAKDKAPQDKFIITRTYEVGDLSAVNRDQILEPANLRPSKVAKQEREAAEPAAAFAVDELIEMIRQTVEPDTWDTIDGVEITPKGRFLFVTTVGRVHAGIARLLQRLREFARKQVVIDVVALPVTKETAALLAQRPRELTDAEAKALAAVAPLGAARLTCFDGQQAVQRSGVTRSYLGEYDVEIASSATIGDPIRRQVLDGCSVEIRACLDRGGKGVVLHCRLERTKVTTVRRLDTEHGPIDLPQMTVTRVGTSFWAPLGRTVVAGGATGGDSPCVFLVTPQLVE